MKSLFIFIFFFYNNSYAEESKVEFSTQELNENELIASSGTDIATASRVFQLQLRASGCSRPILTSPDKFKSGSKYSFNIDSENCTVISKSKKCPTGYSPRFLKPNPRSKLDTILGVNKYIVCLNSSFGSSGKTTTPNENK